MDWIRIILGVNENTNFSAVTVINGNISKPLKIGRGCRQGDPIAGYLFILTIEILELLLKNSKIKPYKSKKGNTHLLDIYADDLTTYLEYNRVSKKANINNIRMTLGAIDLFYRWSGLKINRGKTQCTIFGKEVSQPEYVEQLRIKWCTKFELIGIKFDMILSEMDCNYEKGFQSMQDVMNSWKFRHLSIFNKLTVIKTLCLPKLTHIATVILNLSSTKISEIEACWKNSIKDGNKCPLERKTRYASKSKNGLGMLKLADF